MTYGSLPSRLVAPLLLSAALLCLFCFSFVASASAAPAWQPAQTISDLGKAATRYPQVAIADDGSAVAVWASTGAAGVLAASRPAGGNWSRPFEPFPAFQGCAQFGASPRPRIGVDASGRFTIAVEASNLLAATAPAAAGPWTVSTIKAGCQRLYNLAVSRAAAAAVSFLAEEGGRGTPVEIGLRPAAGAAWAVREVAAPPAGGQLVGSTSPAVAITDTATGAFAGVTWAGRLADDSMSLEYRTYGIGGAVIIPGLVRRITTTQASGAVVGEQVGLDSNLRATIAYTMRVNRNRSMGAWRADVQGIVAAPSAPVALGGVGSGAQDDTTTLAVAPGGQALTSWDMRIPGVSTLSLFASQRGAAGDFPRPAGATRIGSADYRGAFYTSAAIGSDGFQLLSYCRPTGDLVALTGEPGGPLGAQQTIAVAAGHEFCGGSGAASAGGNAVVATVNDNKLVEVALRVEASGGAPAGPQLGAPAGPQLGAPAGPQLTVTAEPKRSVGSGSVTVTATCPAEACTANAAGSLKGRRTTKSTQDSRRALSRGDGSVAGAANAPIELTVKPTAASKKLMGKIFKAGRSVSATVTVSAQNAAGGTTTKTVDVPVLRGPKLTVKRKQKKSFGNGAVKFTVRCPKASCSVRASGKMFGRPRGSRRLTEVALKALPATAVARGRSRSFTLRFASTALSAPLRSIWNRRGTVYAKLTVVARNAGGGDTSRSVTVKLRRR